MSRQLVVFAVALSVASAIVGEASVRGASGLKVGPLWSGLAKPSVSKPIVTRDVHHDTSPALRDIKPILSTGEKQEAPENPMRQYGYQSAAGRLDPAVQTTKPLTPMPGRRRASTARSTPAAASRPIRTATSAPTSTSRSST